ncbi:hypothetical protein BH11PSE11_BH11PSE11_11170 [soil metagenome]
MDEMKRPTISRAVRKLVKTSIPSVPHLEALILIQASAGECWDADHLSSRLYIGHDECRAVLRDLYMSGFLRKEEKEDGLNYRYSPLSDSVQEGVEQLAKAHGTNLRGITDLIHANARKYQQWWSHLYNQDN